MNSETLETQPWVASPEDYVNSWLEQQKLEHAARVEAAQVTREKEEHEAMAKGLEEKLRRSEHIEKPAAKLK